MQRLIFGGTFDPVHLGHIAVAEAVCDYFGFPACHFLPNAKPAAYKQACAEAADRRYMLTSVLDVLNLDKQRFYLDDRELKRGGVSYTYQTLQEIRHESGNQAGLFWLTGSDAFNGLARWHQWRVLFDLVNFIVVTRPGHPLQLTDATLADYYQTHVMQDKTVFLQCEHGAIYTFNRVEADISSTAIRQAIHTGATVDAYLPRQVSHYIMQQQLYNQG